MKRIALGLFSRLALVWLAAAVPALAAPPAARAAGTVRVALGPSVTTAMIAQYLEESGIWKAWGSRAGIDFRIGSARNANSRLAQKEEDVVLLSPIDVARLAVEDSLEVVIWGKDSTSYEALYTQAKQVGEAPRDFKGMRFVHPGWNTRGTRI
jgi:ABC-type nitrate/sulfonate/bicarbonate transport system substrate-binding protein